MTGTGSGKSQVVKGILVDRKPCEPNNRGPLLPLTGLCRPVQGFKFQSWYRSRELNKSLLFTINNSIGDAGYFYSVFGVSLGFGKCL